MKVIKVIGCVLYIITLLTINVNAHYHNNYSMEELCEKSSTIVIAEVKSINSFYYSEEDKRIFTSIVLHVKESLKGALKSYETFEIIRYGGTLDGVTVFRVGDAQFRTGEETLLFLRKVDSKDFGENYNVQGVSEGKFNIRDNMVFRSDAPALKETSTKASWAMTKDSPMDKALLINKIKDKINN